MSQINLIEKKSEETRARIFEVALSFIEQEGADKLTIRKLAENASVSPALIIQYFGNKGSLLHEAFLHYSSQILSRFEDIPPFDPSIGLHGVLMQLVSVYLERDLKHPGLTMLVSAHAMSLEESPEQFEARVEPTLQIVAGVLQQCVPGLSTQDARTGAGTAALFYGHAIRYIIKRGFTRDQAIAFMSPHLKVLSLGIEQLAK